jgi:hypothetical protein
MEASVSPTSDRNRQSMRMHSGGEERVASLLMALPRSDGDSGLLT